MRSHVRALGQPGEPGTDIGLMRTGTHRAHHLFGTDERQMQVSHLSRMAAVRCYCKRLLHPEPHSARRTHSTHDQGCTNHLTAAITPWIIPTAAVS